MEFKGPYLQAMAEQAPKMLKALQRSGTMLQHAQEKSEEAYAMLADLLKNEPKFPNGVPKSLQAEPRAEEIVMSLLIEFPPEGNEAKSQTPR